MLSATKTHARVAPPLNPAPEELQVSQTPVANSPSDPSHGVKGPGFPLVDGEVTCPSCGRFAGTYERCPFCGAGMQVRLSIRVLRRLSVAVGILGVLMVWWAAKNMEIPLREVASFSPTQNFAILRVRGKIVSGPFYGDRGDSFYIGLDDGTGRINVKAYGSTAVQLKALALNPQDQVEAQGSIRIMAGRKPAMSLRIASDVRVIERSKAPPPRRELSATPIDKITQEMASNRGKARIEGVVEKVWTTSSGMGSMVKDSTGSLLIWMFSKELGRIPDLSTTLAPGNRVQITGRLNIYSKRGGSEQVLQLRPFANKDGIRLLEKGSRSELPPKLLVKPPTTPGIDEVGKPAPQVAPVPGPGSVTPSVAPVPGPETVVPTPLATSSPKTSSETSP